MKKTILIVDDDKEVLGMFKDCLEDFSFEVCAVESAEKALEIFKSKKIDCIVTDIKMTGMSGVDLAKLIRLQSDSLPLFFVTGYMDYSREELNNFKPKAVIFKPFDIEEAALLVKNHLERNS